LIEIGFDFDATRFWLVLVVRFFVMLLVMLLGEFLNWVIELWIQHEGNTSDDQTIRKDDYLDLYIAGQGDLRGREVLSADQAMSNHAAVAWPERK